MSERRLKPNEDIERINLDTLKIGDEVTIKTGADDNAWTYHFVVEEAGQWPKGKLIGFAPDGSETESVDFSLHGAGNWTTRQQNPVQKQDRGFTSYFDSIYLDGFMVGQFEGYPDRAVFDNPDQKITHIDIKHSEN